MTPAIAVAIGMALLGPTGTSAVLLTAQPLVLGSGKNFRPQRTSACVFMTVWLMGGMICSHLVQLAVLQFAPLGSWFIEPDLSWTMRTSAGCFVVVMVVTPQFMLSVG